MSIRTAWITVAYLACTHASPALAATDEVPAQTAAPAASCFADPALARPDEAKAFLGNPTGVIEALPADDLAIIGQVRVVVMTDPAAAAPMVDLLKSLPPARAKAVAAGLGRAVGDCEKTQLQVATEIQNLVATIDDEALLTAFMAALSDQRVASLGDDTPMANGGAISLGSVGQLGAVNNYIKGADDSTPTEPGVFSKFDAGTYTYDSVSPTT